MSRDLSIPSPFRGAARALLDGLLPRACLLCGGRAGAEALCAACAACAADLPSLPAPRCPICAAPLALAAPACGACLAKPPAFDATVAAWRYAFPLDGLVRDLKFRHRLAGAEFLARGMLAGQHPPGTLIVPVPLGPLRLRERGFNPAGEIARQLARALGLPLDTHCLARIRETAPQSRLPWRARRGNVRRAFACAADLTGREAIVVDDVMTTGATLDAVARVLKDHGATRVVNWVAARAVKASPDDSAKRAT